MGWSSLSNGELLAQAETEFDGFVTTDSETTFYSFNSCLIADYKIVFSIVYERSVNYFCVTAFAEGWRESFAGSD